MSSSTPLCGLSRGRQQGSYSLLALPLSTPILMYSTYSLFSVSLVGSGSSPWSLHVFSTPHNPLLACATFRCVFAFETLLIAMACGGLTISGLVFTCSPGKFTPVLSIVVSLWFLSTFFLFFFFLFPVCRGPGSNDPAQSFDIRVLAIAMASDLVCLSGAPFACILGAFLGASMLCRYLFLFLDESIHTNYLFKVCFS